jgi:hypothetical protein
MATLALPVVGTALQSFFFYRKADKVRDAIQQITAQISQNAHSLVNSTFSNMTIQQIELSRNFEMGLQSLRNGYEQELDFTVEKADQFVQNALAELDAFVHRSIIGPLTSPAAKEMADRVQMLISQLPFADQTPYVFAIHPACFALNNFENDVRVEIRGGFPQFPKEDEEEEQKVSIPTLIILGKSFSAQTFYQNRIDFFVPAKALFPIESRSSAKVSYSCCTIEIPFSGKIYTHGTSFHLLPEIAGTVTLSYTKIETQIKTQEFNSPIYTQNSRKEKMPIINRPYTFSLPQGWQVIQEPRLNARIIEIKSETSGPHSQQIFTTIPTSISCTVSTYGQMGVDKSKNVGKIQFHLNCMASCKEETTTHIQEGPLSLSWGRWTEIDESKKDCMIIFNSFDGGQHVYDARREHQDLFVRISRIGKKSIFFVKPADAIIAPHFGNARL